jgi:murein DD-endopeptidase MepM/ murein hydrolase activator NlpD
MWRARPGKPDSAADVGAAPGSTVYSPVDGTVVRIRPYKLYGRVDDFEIHIQPTGHPELDLVMIHVDELQVAKGDAVSAGVTPLAVVRKISDQIHTQLADYVTEGGNHAHFQINDVTNPDYKGLTKK